MGVAIIIPNVNFEDNNLGQVTPREHIAVQSLSIIGDSVVYGSGEFSVSYNPSDTDEIGVYWSVESGSEHATIDSHGVLSVVSGSDADTVVIKATSVYSPSVYATKTLTVTKDAEYITRKYLQNTVGAYVATDYYPEPNFKISVKYEISNIVSSRNQVFGSRLSSSSQVLSFHLSVDGTTNKAHFACGQSGGGNAANANLGASILNSPNELVATRTTLNFNGEEKTYSGVSFNATKPIDLFGINLNGTHEPTNLIIKIYKVSIYSGETLVKTFTPAIRVADNAIGFYDEVGDVFYTNSGTGTLSISED